MRIRALKGVAAEEGAAGVGLPQRETILAVFSGKRMWLCKS